MKIAHQGSLSSPLVHVCTFVVTHYVNRMAELVAVLSPEERERACRFRQEIDQTRFIIARAFVRRLCALQLGVGPTSVKLDQTIAGKPYLSGDTEGDVKRFQFNVSHSGDCVLVAWSYDLEVGVDVELVRNDSRKSLESIYTDVLSDTERGTLCAIAPTHIPNTLHRAWVRKEAVLKAEGCGIICDLRSFSVFHQPATFIEWIDVVRYPASGRSWKMYEFTPALNHVAAVASAPNSMFCPCTPEDAKLA